MDEEENRGKNKKNRKFIRWEEEEKDKFFKDVFSSEVKEALLFCTQPPHRPLLLCLEFVSGLAQILLIALFFLGIFLNPEL